MSKKAVIISIAAVLLIAGGVATGLWVFRDVINPPVQNNANFEPDRSVDYGACRILTKDTIKAELGDVAKDLKDGFDSGKVFYSDGIESQYCSYDFASDTAAGNFKVEVIMKNTEAGIEEATQLLSDDDAFTEVSVGGATGFYRETTDQTLLDSPRVTHFTLTFFEGTTQYALSINLPEDSTTFDTESATQALTSLGAGIEQP
jgi:hypothetical protein